MGSSPYQYVLNEQEYRLLDLGGHERIREIWGRFFGFASGVVFVLDGSNRQRSDTQQNLLEECRAAGKPLLVFANKADLNANGQQGEGLSVSAARGDQCIREEFERFLQTIK